MRRVAFVVTVAAVISVRAWAELEPAWHPPMLRGSAFLCASPDGTMHFTNLENCGPSEAEMQRAVDEFYRRFGVWPPPLWPQTTYAGPKVVRAIPNPPVSQR